ncbi:MAG: hypothetical protein ACW99E_21180 [Promethearchaeota archaeon]
MSKADRHPSQYRRKIVRKRRIKKSSLGLILIFIFLVSIIGTIALIALS